VIDQVNVVAVVVVALVSVDGDEFSSNGDGDGVGWLMATDEVSLDRHHSPETSWSDGRTVS
jgi:hypothetical protein